MTLNGVPLTDSIFKKHCYVVKQQDKHWPFLTARETLTFAAELFEVADKKADISQIVDGIIHKMGLDICADTRCARLSGGQARRLSIAVALLKQPTVLFLGTKHLVEPKVWTLHSFAQLSLPISLSQTFFQMSLPRVWTQPRPQTSCRKSFASPKMSA